MAACVHSARVRTVVSCPAKVLVGGGYLVLDPDYTGTVVATSSRFYAYFDHKLDSNTSNKHPDKNDDSKPTKVLIVFRSPQFLNAEWIYLLTWSVEEGSSKDGNLTIEQLPDKNGLTSENPFLETAALQSFRVGIGLSGVRCFDAIETDRSDEGGDPHKNIIVLVADNDFYSQPRDQIDGPPFNALDVPISEVHKTGLGSSAAMVTSICGAMLLRLVPSLLDDQVSGSLSKKAKQLIHNLAQYVHSTAQGKIGSGFDISAAVWGTHVYRRFSKECLSVLPSGTLSKDSPAGILALLDPKTNPLWTNESTAPRVTSFALPPLTTLMLADVDAGSHTPSMVGKVFQWVNANPDKANFMFNSISILNKQLGELCIRLNTLFAQDQLAYITEVKNLSQQSNLNQTGRPKSLSEEDGVHSLFQNLRVTMRETRGWMRKMGEASCVPIEPPSQTELLDECDKLTGVIGSGVPGAGGYDAIWVLVFSPPECIQTGAENVRNLWNSWSKVSVRALSRDACVEGGQSELPTGIRIETVEHVKGLADVLNGTRRMSTVAITQ